MRHITPATFALLLAAACNSTNYGAPASTVGTGAVSVVSNAFSPGTVRPDTNGVVVWTWNSGGVTHNVTFEDSIPGSGDKSSGTFSHTFLTPGTYRFRCTIHSTAFGSGMHGTVVVGVATPPDTTTGGGYGY